MPHLPPLASLSGLLVPPTPPRTGSRHMVGASLQEPPQLISGHLPRGWGIFLLLQPPPKEPANMTGLAVWCGRWIGCSSIDGRANARPSPACLPALCLPHGQGASRPLVFLPLPLREPVIAQPGQTSVEGGQGARRGSAEDRATARSLPISQPASPINHVGGGLWAIQQHTGRPSVEGRQGAGWVRAAE